VDDLLDLVGDPDLMGKPVGNDLRDARVTLPLIVALRNGAGQAGTPDARDALAARGVNPTDLGEVVKFVRDHGGVEYSLDLAREFAGKARLAVERLPQGPQVRSLMLLADHAVERKK
jgi:geranylgeranyl pyrophosphate synthase